MNYYQQGFKGEITNAISALTRKTWLKITGVYAIKFLGLILLFVALFSVIFSSKIDLLRNSADFSDPESLLAFYEELFLIITGSTQNLILVVFSVLLSGVIYSWGLYLQILITDKQIKQNVIEFSVEFKKSFNMQVFRILGMSVLLYLMLVGLYSLAISTAGISGFISFILLIVATIFILRLFTAIPVMVLEQKSILESIIWSYKHITWLRALKILGIGFLAILAMLVVLFLVGLVSGLFAIIPVIGPLVQLAANVLIGGVLAALTTSTLLGVYYRYAEDIKEDNELDTDELLISEDKY